ncbi:TetR family transcriptional regulator [Mucilaginibacter sp.]|uniref:TetR family transcriptional regulator n=1 Tax=Mucilaginibacter sp. TaxID=1882438 RepID=UPI0035BBF544
MSITADIFSNARTKLLLTAEKLFAQRGYELTSTRHIAGAAGTNISLISYYFGSKQLLYREIFCTRLKEMVISLQCIKGQPLSAIDKLGRFLMIYMDSYRLNGNFQRMLYREMLSLSPSPIRDTIVDFLAENEMVFQAIMAQGIAEGDFRPLNTSFYYITLISMLSMIICDVQVDGDMPAQTYTTDEIRTYLYQILLANSNSTSSMN